MSLSVGLHCFFRRGCLSAIESRAPFEIFSLFGNGSFTPPGTYQVINMPLVPWKANDTREGYFGPDYERVWNDVGLGIAITIVFEFLGAE